MPARNRTYTAVDGLMARAGRAHEDPAEMTRDATWSRVARYVAEILKQNPDLTAEQAARGARLKMRADMGRLAQKSAAARKAGDGDAA